MNKEEIREDLERLKINSTELALKVECITNKMDKVYDAMILEYGDIERLPSIEMGLLTDYATALDRIENML